MAATMQTLPRTRHATKGSFALVLVMLLLQSEVGCRRGSGPIACDELISTVVAGRPLPDDAARLSGQARLVYECRAIETNDPGICDHFPVETRDNCRARYVFWNGARMRTGDTPWTRVMADGIAMDCKNPTSGVSPAVCAQLVGAIAASDPSRCAGLAGMPGRMCRGIAGADPKACEGNQDCVELSSRMVLLQQGGLARVLRDATEVDQADAAAALGHSNACRPLIDRLRAACERK